jgi:hypothetical protein
MKHTLKVMSKEEVLANRSSAYDFIDFDSIEASSKSKGVFNCFRKDFTEMYPNSEGVEKTLVRPTDIYSKVTLSLNRKLNIHKVNKGKK